MNPVPRSTGCGTRGGVVTLRSVVPGGGVPRDCPALPGVPLGVSEAWETVEQ